MRVLVLSTMYPSQGNFVSGIFVHHQAKALRAAGVDLRVIAPIPLTPWPLAQFSRKWRAYQQVPAHESVEGIEVVHPRFIQFPRSWFMGTSGERLYLSLGKLIENIYEEFPFDIVHAHAALPAGHAALRVAEKFGKPCIVTVHGADMQTAVDISPNCAKVVGNVLTQASRTVFVSNKLRRLAVKRFGYHTNWCVIPNGIDPTILHPERLNQYSFPTILSVSNLIKSKGIEFNLLAIRELVAKYPSLQYLIVGDGPAYKELVKLTRALDLVRNVTFLGKRTQKEVMSFMASCDLFSLPSWREGFGVVYLEALAHGKPVVGCKGEGLEDFVVDGVNGRLVRPNDVIDLTAAIDELLSHPERAQEMGAHGRTMVLEHFTWQRNAFRTIALYQKVWADHRRDLAVYPESVRSWKNTLDK